MEMRQAAEAQLIKSAISGTNASACVLGEHDTS